MNSPRVVPVVSTATKVRTVAFIIYAIEQFNMATWKNFKTDGW